MKRFFVLIVCLFLIQSSASAQTDKKVEIFVTAWCPYCRQMESFLKERKVEYTRYDVEKDAKGAAIFRELGASGVPVARVGDKVLFGYDPEALLTALK